MAGQHTASGLRVRLSVRVQPKASRNSITVNEEGQVKIWLTAPAVDGQANAALIEFLAEFLGVKKRCVAIVGGERSRDKLIDVVGLSSAMLSERLHALRQS
ncbi:MAG: hypothetical protein AMXMBFR4_34310 [Candidatus Hydrogenedentota bacterium]